MNNDEGRIDPAHTSTRSTLRVLGAVLLVLGLLMMAFGGYRMFSPAWRGSSHATVDFPGSSMRVEFQDHARTAFSGFAMVAVGMICAAVGGAMLTYGYMGRVARYAAGEMAPVASDTINYMGTSTREGVHDVAEAIAGGIRDGTAQRPSAPGGQTTCPGCMSPIAPGSRFCSQCGRELER
jgi:hypothetical protein